MTDKSLFVGICGSIVSIEKETGRELWSTHLTKYEFVTFTADDNSIYAHTSGHLFCIDKENGTILWKNELKGLGNGFASILADSESNSISAIVQQIQAQDKAQQSDDASAVIIATAAITS